MSASSIFPPPTVDTDCFICVKYGVTGGSYITVRKKHELNSLGEPICKYYRLNGALIALDDPLFYEDTQICGPCNIEKQSLFFRIGGDLIATDLKPDGDSIDTSIGIFANRILKAISVTVLSGSDDVTQTDLVTYSFFNNQNPARAIGAGETVGWSSDDCSLTQNALIISAFGMGNAIITALVM